MVWVCGKSLSILVFRYDDIGADAVAEMQRYLNEWKEKYGRTSYLLTTKHAIRIPWEEMK